MAFKFLVGKFKKGLPIDFANEKNLPREAACLGLEYQEVAPSSLLFFLLPLPVILGSMCFGARLMMKGGRQA